MLHRTNARTLPLLSLGSVFGCSGGNDLGPPHSHPASPDAGANAAGACSALEDEAQTQLSAVVAKNRSPSDAALVEEPALTWTDGAVPATRQVIHA